MKRAACRRVSELCEEYERKTCLRVLPSRRPQQSMKCERHRQSRHGVPKRLGAPVGQGGAEAVGLRESRRTTTRACLGVEYHCHCKARVRGEAAIRRDSQRATKVANDLHYTALELVEIKSEQVLATNTNKKPNRYDRRVDDCFCSER